MADSPRDLDVVLFGATGFTGGLVAKFLASRYGGREVRWGIAGRNRDKLERLKAELVEEAPSCSAVEVIVADVEDEAALEAMAERTRVVATTAGPFIRYGEPVVKACVLRGADYVDITGEPEFVDMTRDRYHPLAEKKGVRVVSCCGFDSVPHDMGALFTVQQLPADRPITLRGFVRAGGTFSGGTWTSAVEAMSRMRQQRGKKRPHRPKEDDDERSIHGLRRGVHYESALSAWAAPMPTIDPQVVLRSARTLPEYGPEFRYGHYMRFKRLPMMLGTFAFVGSVFALAQTKPTRELLYRVRKPGQGPTPEQIEKGWFEVTFIGEAGDESVITRVSGGDPGYGDTSKMLAECALCLAFDRDRIPDRAGVLTTATAMGEPLFERLGAAGIRFEVVE